MLDWKKFIKAGRAVFTVENTMTGMRFTFKVNKHETKDLWFVSVLRGPDNTCDYLYIGAVFDTEFRRTKKSRVGENAQSYQVFKWLSDILHSDLNLPNGVKIYHEGRCGRCGRTLTVPQSIEWGFGPDCVGLVGLESTSSHIPLETAKQVRALLKLSNKLKQV
jgi:hypothetical protein